MVLKLGGELLEGPEQADRDRQGVARAAAKRAAGRRARRRPRDRCGAGRGRHRQAAGRRPARDRRGHARRRRRRCWPGRSTRGSSRRSTPPAARPVGLTGADAGVAPVKQAAPHTATSGDTVDLGHGGHAETRRRPDAADRSLCKAGYVPVVACISASKDGQLFNVNADTLAGSLAARLKAKRLVIAGATAGVLDSAGQTIPRLNRRARSRSWSRRARPAPAWSPS